jgi:hypothetical protein
MMSCWVDRSGSNNDDHGYGRQRSSTHANACGGKAVNHLALVSTWPLCRRRGATRCASRRPGKPHRLKGIEDLGRSIRATRELPPNRPVKSYRHDAARDVRLHHSTLEDRLASAEAVLRWDVRTPQGRLRLQLAVVLRRGLRTAG